MPYAVWCCAGPAIQSVTHEAALALACLKYLPVGTGEGAALVTEALQARACVRVYVRRVLCVVYVVYVVCVMC